MNSVFNDIGASDIEMVVPYKIVVDIVDYEASDGKRCLGIDWRTKDIPNWFIMNIFS